MKKKEFYIPSRDGVHRLHVVLWEPETEVRAVVQISHGMTEMIERYQDFALFLAWLCGDWKRPFRAWPDGWK